MAWCPFARHRPLPENSTEPRIDPTQVILHTAVDAPGKTDLFGYFVQGHVTVESHFFVQLDGTLIQYMDTTRQADANRHANARAVSIETEDDGSIRPWTPAQLATIKRLGDWLMSVHPRIVRRVCPAWNQPGWGFHTMWGAPSQWTPVQKTCPGSARIAQFKSDIAPWLSRGPAPQTEDHEMLSREAVDQVGWKVIEVINVGLKPGGFIREPIEAAVRDAMQAELTTKGDPSRTAVRELAQMGANDAEKDG